MAKYSSLNKSVSTILLILLVSTFFFAQNSKFIGDAKAQQVTPVLQVVPSNVTVAYPGSFTITVKIYNVTNLFGWQVRLRFDDHVANTTVGSISLPADHVFNYTTSDKIYQLGPYLTISGTKSGPALPPEPYTRIDISVFLLGDPATTPAFNGSGTLFKATFTGTGSGITALEFVTAETKLKENKYPPAGIPFTVVNGQVTVTGGPAPGKPGSAISIKADPATVKVGSTVTISGAINLTRPDVDVTIKYRPTGGTFSQLAVVKTNSNSGYTYAWNTTATAVDVYEIQASWAGDAETNGAESEIKTVTIQEVITSQPDYTLYIAGAIIAVAIIAALVLYFVKFRKT